MSLLLFHQALYSLFDALEELLGTAQRGNSFGFIYGIVPGVHLVVTPYLGSLELLAAGMGLI